MAAVLAFVSYGTPKVPRDSGASFERGGLTIPSITLVLLCGGFSSFVMHIYIFTPRTCPRGKGVGA